MRYLNASFTIFNEKHRFVYIRLVSTYDGAVVGWVVRALMTWWKSKIVISGVIKLESEESERFYFFISRFVVFRGIKSDDVLQRNANTTSIFQHGGSISTEVRMWHTYAYGTQIPRANIPNVAAEAEEPTNHKARNRVLRLVDSPASASTPAIYFSLGQFLLATES